MSVRLEIAAIINHVVRDTAVPLDMLQEKREKGRVHEKLEVGLKRCQKSKAERENKVKGFTFW